LVDRICVVIQPLFNVSMVAMEEVHCCLYDAPLGQDSLLAHLHLHHGVFLVEVHVLVELDPDPLLIGAIFLIGVDDRVDANRLPGVTQALIF
jgi:hypothetical protein